MTPAEFCRIRDRLGLTNLQLSSFMMMTDRAIRFYATGQRPVHPAVAKIMQLLDEGKISI